MFNREEMEEGIVSEESSNDCKWFAESILFEQTFRTASPQDLINSLPNIATDISSGDEELEISASKSILYLLKPLKLRPSYGAKAVEAVIQYNNGFMVPHLLRLMAKGLPDAAKTVLIILKGTYDQAKAVMNHGGAASFTQILDFLTNHLNHALILEALKGLEQIFSLSIEYRHEMVNLGAISHLTTILDGFTRDQRDGPEIVHEILRCGASVLKILVSAYPEDTIKMHVLIVLPTLMRFINMSIEHRSVVVGDACVALHSLSKGSPERLRGIVGAQLCQRIVFILRDSSKPFQSALDFTQTIMESREAMVLANNGVLTALNYILTETSLHFHWWTVCNIIYAFAFNGDIDIVQMILDADLMAPLFQISQSEHESLGLKRQAVNALAAMAMNGSYEHSRLMEDEGCLIKICEYLNNDERLTQVVCFEALENMLAKGEENKDDTGGVNIFVQPVSALGGFRTLFRGRLGKDLQYSGRVTLLLKKYDWYNYMKRNYR